MSIFFAFPGQGAQFPGMLSTLPDTAPVRATLEEAAANPSPHWTLRRRSPLPEPCSFAY